MAGAKYELLLTARLDKDTSKLAMDLKKKMAELDTLGIKDYKISIKTDGSALKKFSVDWTNALGNAEKYVRELVPATKEAKSSIKGFSTETAKATEYVGSLQKASVRYKNSLNELIKTQELEKTAEADIAALKKSGVDDISTKKKYDEALGEVVRETVKYTDETGKAVSTTYSYGRSLDGTTPELKKMTDETERSEKATNSLSHGIFQSIKSAAQYALGIGVVYKALGQLRNGVEYIKELDKEMRNISLVTGKTGRQISDLAVEYNGLAKELGATTLEVASGSLEWIRQGKTLEETQELLQSTMMLSKLGNLSSSDATENLTAVLNSYKLEAKDAIGVVNKLVAIDNLSATSVEEMSLAFRRAAVSASDAGIDIDHLAAYVGTVLSVTREAPEKVGTAFKTMTARFKDIKSGALDGEGAINNVEAALSRVTLASGEQMSIMNRQTGKFKDFSVVIEQLSSQWDTLSEKEQSNIIKAIAGKHTNARMCGNMQMYAYNYI